MEYLAEHFDLPILDWIAANLQCPALDALMPFVSLLAKVGIFYIVLALTLTAVPKTRRVGLCTVLALSFGLLFCNVLIKPIVGRIRPADYQLLHFGKVIPLLVSPPSDASFPSGHTVAAFAFAAAIWDSSKKAGIGFFILAVFMAFSRVYLYVHYPSDVLVAAVLGTCTGILGTYLGKKIMAKKQ